MSRFLVLDEVRTVNPAHIVRFEVVRRSEVKDAVNVMNAPVRTEEIKGDFAVVLVSSGATVPEVLIEGVDQLFAQSVVFEICAMLARPVGSLWATLECLVILQEVLTACAASWKEPVGA